MNNQSQPSFTVWKKCPQTDHGHGHSHGLFISATYYGRKMDDQSLIVMVSTEIPTIIDPSATIKYPGTTGSIIVGISAPSFCGACARCMHAPAWKAF